jgi:hypothetical protein
MHVAVHLLVSTSTSFLATLIVLKFICLHAPLHLVLEVTLIFNLVIFGIIEVICLLRQRTRSAELCLESQKFEAYSDTPEKQEEGRRLVLW